MKLASALLILVVSGCEDRALRKEIVGEWASSQQGAGGSTSAHLVFDADGTCSKDVRSESNVKGSPPSAAMELCTWKIDDGNLTRVFTGLNPTTEPMTITDGVLEISGEKYRKRN